MKIQNLPIKLTAEILCFLYECNIRGKHCLEKDVFNFFKRTPNYISKGLKFLYEKNIVENKSGNLNITKKYLKDLNGSIQKSKQLIKETIIDYQPFVEYTYFIGKGKDVQESVRLIKTIYGINQSENYITRTFEEWIKFLDINIKIKPTSNKNVRELEESSRDKLSANKFLKNEFGDFYHQISDVVLDDLSTAIQKIIKEPAESINAAGRALEDFFRLDIGKKVDLTKCSGIVQITNELNKFPDYPNKLNNISAALGNVRSMGKAHGVDKKLKERWKITEPSVIGYIILIISIIKSYLEYNKTKQLIF